MGLVEEFWAKQEYHSAVKAAFVAKYFGAWARIISNKFSGHLAYVDLFAGCGIYGDGKKSTPILVLEQIASDSKLRHRLISVFNDGSPEAIECLKRAIDTIPEISELGHKPVVFSEEVGPALIHKLHRLCAGMPTLLFVDPFGYKGLSVELIVSFVEKWGSDCIFFFNYNRISAGLHNPRVEDHMVSIFGSKMNVEQLRNEVKGLESYRRERCIIEALKNTLQHHAKVKLYVVPMRFEDEQQNRCSHHLIFASKNKTGYKIAKNIMLAESNGIHDGVASFILDPKQETFSALFPPDALSEVLLSDDLLTEFAGHTLTVEQIIERHDQGNNLYTDRNYKDTLLLMESRSLIITEPTLDKRPQRKGMPTLSNTVRVTFPQGT